MFQERLLGHTYIAQADPLHLDVESTPLDITGSL